MSYLDKISTQNYSYLDDCILSLNVVNEIREMYKEIAHIQYGSSDYNKAKVQEDLSFIERSANRVSDVKSSINKYANDIVFEYSDVEHLRNKTVLKAILQTNIPTNISVSKPIPQFDVTITNIGVKPLLSTDILIVSLVNELASVNVSANVNIGAAINNIGESKSIKISTLIAPNTKCVCDFIIKLNRSDETYSQRIIPNINIS